MPLIDVVFLLLTFFIYAVVLMDRVDVLPMQTAPLLGAAPAEVPPAATISVDAAGALYIDREPVTFDDLVPELERRLAEQPDTVVYVAASQAGERDRLPVFLELYGRLSDAGIPLSLVSIGGESGDDAARDSAGAGAGAGRGRGTNEASSPGAP